MPDMSQVDLLFNYQSNLQTGQAIASVVTSGDSDAIPIHLFVLSRKWTKIKMEHMCTRFMLYSKSLHSA